MQSRILMTSLHFNSEKSISVAFLLEYIIFYAENKKRFSRLCDGGVIYYHHQQKINDNKDGDYMTDSEKLNLILEKVSNLDEKVSNLDEKVSNLDEKVSNLEFQLQEVKEQTTQTSLILENEIRVNIQRVAEGHLDLSRNLHEAMRPSNEVEMLAIKVRMLETDIRGLKARLA